MADDSDKAAYLALEKKVLELEDRTALLEQHLARYYEALRAGLIPPGLLAVLQTLSEGEDEEGQPPRRQ